MTLTAWATMSCNSRVIRARSSATAMRAADSRSRSAWLARWSAASTCAARARRANPASQAIANSTGTKMNSPGVRFGSLKTTITAPLTTMSSPIRACASSRRLPSRKAAAIPAAWTPNVYTTSPSTNENAGPSSHTAAGAPNGNAPRPSSGSTTRAAARAANHADVWSPRAASSVRAASSAPAIAASTISTSNPWESARNLSRLTRPT
jgi:hypothetical protein